MEFTKDQINYLPISKAWRHAESPNDVDKPVFIKKWSNCEDKLVFKLNAQILETVHPLSDFDDNCIKVLQIVNRNGNEIVLKYNTGMGFYFLNLNRYC